MLHTLSAIEIRDLFITGKRSAVSIVQTFLNRIEKYDPLIGAFLEVYKETALEEARKLDHKKSQGYPVGKLAAIPIALKDNIHMKGEITTCGSKFLTNFHAPFDATVTRLLKEEDAIIIGKTNMDEFAMGSSTENSALQPTHNPWDLSCSPGGSSGGSAAAVAARLCPLALGSDTGGSVRQPAGLCGIIGFKPTYGRVSRYGLVAYGSSLDQIGPFATTPKDAALLMEVLGRHCEKDSTSIQKPVEEYLTKMNGNIKGKRIGVPRSLIETLNEKGKQQFNKSLETLKSLGTEIVDIDLDIFKYAIAIYYILATAEASTNLARFDGIRYGVRSSRAKTLEQVYDYSKEEGFGPEVKRRILLGTYVLSSGYQDAYYRKAQKVRTLMIQKCNEAFKKCDVIATPTSPSTAFKAGSIKDPLQMYLEDIYTIPANLVGMPAINIPCGFSADGKPYGLQISAPQEKDLLAFQIAEAFCQANHSYQQIPELTRETRQ